MMTMMMKWRGELVFELETSVPTLVVLEVSMSLI
jgi:hypothetical protein